MGLAKAGIANKNSDCCKCTVMPLPTIKACALINAMILLKF